MAFNPATEDERRLRDESEPKDYGFQQQESEDPGRVTEIAAAGDTGGVQIRLTPPKEAPEPDESRAAEEARIAAARRIAKAQTSRDIAPPTISTAEEYLALRPEQEFIDPKGKRRRKPYEIKDEFDYEQVPEGKQFIDPKGVLRLKPVTQPISSSAQILYNMAYNDKERENVLKKFYPGKVHKNERTGDLEVHEDDGTIRRAKGGAAEFIAAQAAPVGLSVLGAVGGAAAGGVGGVAGGMGGALLGQSFNDLVMTLAGVVDRSKWEEFGGLGVATLSAGAGAGVGKGIATVAPAIGFGRKGLPAFAAGFLGAEREGLETLIRMKEKGLELGPAGMWAKESPYLQKVDSVFDPAFRTQQPMRQSGTTYYRDQAGNIMEEAGVKPGTDILEPTAAIPLEPTGKAIKQKFLDEAAVADVALAKQVEARKADAALRVEKTVAERQADNQALQEAADRSRQAADNLIKNGFEDIQRDVDAAMTTAKAGHNSGDLWWAVGEKLKAVRTGIQERARIMYDAADQAAGANKPNIGGLSDKAEEFLRSLPDGFDRQHPSIVQQIRDLAGVKELDTNGNWTGKWVKEPVQPTFGQLHNLRSVMRQNYNRFDLTPDVKEGTFKFFANRVDQILNDANAVPELKDAARLLRETDNFYRENMGPLTERGIQAVMDGLQGGLPADPKILFDVLVKEGRSDLTNKVKELVGPSLWAGVKAADVQEMLDLSKTLMPGVIDGRVFARQVLDRERRNMLQAVHGKEASDRLLKQAQYIEMNAGRLPIAAVPGDTITDVIMKARAAVERAEEAAKVDPIKLLRGEMNTIQKEHAAERQALRQARKDDPLGFLYDPSTGAVEAVQQILKSEDLTLAVATRLGRNSPEFVMLQQIALERLLRGTMLPGERLATMSPAIQEMLFPGTRLQDLQTLAKEMGLFMGALRETGAGESIAAQSRVLNPWTGGGKLIGGLTKLVPGVNSLGRFSLGKYYKLITEFSNHPGFLRFVMKGLEEGDETTKATIRARLQRAMQLGTITGSGLGESLYQSQ